MPFQRPRKDTCVIQGLGMLHCKQGVSLRPPEWGEVKSTVSGSQTYDFQVDLKIGMAHQVCFKRQRVLIETTIVKSNYFPTGSEDPLLYRNRVRSKQEAECNKLDSDYEEDESDSQNKPDHPGYYIAAGHAARLKVLISGPSPTTMP
jgi:hypothetical protein